MWPSTINHRLIHVLILCSLALFPFHVPSIANANPQSPLCVVPDRYASIQSAVDDTACSEVWVNAGEYNQNLTISRDVTIIGSQGSTLTGRIAVSGANSVRISGFIYQARIDVSGVGRFQLDSGAGSSDLTVAGSAADLQINGGQGLTTLTAQTHLYSPGGKVNLTSAHGEIALEKGSLIDVSGVGNEDGGTVSVWSQQTTFAGQVLGRGGPLGGNGGKIEISGAHLAYAGLVDLTAAHGSSGELVLDPTNYTIAPSGGDITGAMLAGQLALANITIQTVAAGTDPGNIYVNDSISWSSVHSLTLRAQNDVIIQSGRTLLNSGNGGITMRADSDADGVGTVQFGASATVYLSGGSNSVLTIIYNPTSYATPKDFSSFLTHGRLLPYMLVNTLANLQAMDTNLSGNYMLGTDIDASTTNTWNLGAGFMPIGDAANTYKGHFNGDGHTISGLFIFRTDRQAVGLIGYGDYTTILENVNLVNVNISGDSMTGGLVGATYGSIHKVTTGGTVSSINTWVGGVAGVVHNIQEKNPTSPLNSVTDSHSTANVTGNLSIVGGLIGRTFVPVVRSYSTGTVQGGTDVGGLVGDNVSGSISQSFSNSPVNGTSQLGGLVGLNEGSITDSYAIGSVTGTPGTSVNVGGLVGANGGNNPFSPFNALPGSLQQVYSTGAVSGASNVGGLVGSLGIDGVSGTATNSYWDTVSSGQTTSALGTGLSTNQKKQASYAGFDFTNIWGIIEDQSYPFLDWSVQQIFGRVYTDLGSTPAGAGFTVSIAANGSVFTTTTDVNGNYAFALSIPQDALAVFVNDGSLKGATVATTNYTQVSGLDIYANAVVAKSSSTLSNDQLSTVKGTLTGIPYSVDASNNLTLNDGFAFITTNTTSYIVNGNITTTNAGQTYNGAVILQSSALNFTSGGALTFGGLVDGGATLTLNVGANNVSFLGAVGSIIPLGGLTVQNLAGSNVGAAGNMTINGNLSVAAGTFIPSATLSLAGNMAMNGVFGPGAGTLVFDGNTTITGTGTFYFNNVTINAARSVTGLYGTIDVSGNWVNNGSYFHNYGIVEFNGSTTLSGSTDPSFWTVIIAASHSLTAPAGNMNVGGLWQNDGTYNHNNGTVTFTGGVTQVTGGSVTTFNNVVISTGHYFTAPSGILNIFGNWTNNGNFGANNGTIVFTGSSQTISGDSRFYNLTKTVTSAATLTFAAGSTQTIDNTMQLQGASGNRLSLRSSIPGTQWKINPMNNRTVGYLDVKDSWNTNVMVINATGTSSISSGNNIGWNIYTPAVNPISPKSVVQFSLLTFTATATDADLPAEPLTFTLDPGAPAGASITTGGVFTWTPNASHTPGNYPVTIRVSDGMSSSTRTVQITVLQKKYPVFLPFIIR